MSKKILATITIASLLFLNFLFINVPVSYAAATLYLSPATQTVNNGDPFSVAVRVNVTGGDTTNAVQAVLSYPADKLEVTGLDPAGSAFGIEAQATFGGGSIWIARAVTPNPPGQPPATVSGDVLLEKINFKAKVGSGSASVSFTADSQVLTATDPPVKILIGTTPGTYNFTTPPPPPPTPDIKASGSNGPITIGVDKSATLSWTVANATTCSASGDWSGNKSASGGSESTGKLTTVKTYTYKLTCTGPGGTREDSVQVNVSSSPPPSTPSTPVTPSTPEPDKTAPKITNIKVNTSLASTVIEWTTDEAAISLVEYGFNAKYNFTVDSANLTKEHKLNLNPATIAPGTTYHFRVKSADGAGNVATGQDAAFKTGGYTVDIKVVDQQGNPVGGVEVTIASEIQVTKTSKSGVATFKDVAPGKHLVMVKSKDGLVSSAIDVKEATAQEIAAGKIVPQVAQVKITPPGTNPLWYVVATLAGLLVIFISLALFRVRKEWTGFGPKEGPPVGSDKDQSGPTSNPPMKESTAKPEKPQVPKKPLEAPTILPRGESKIDIIRADSKK